jgi:hypothetical protein
MSIVYIRVTFFAVSSVLSKFSQISFRIFAIIVSSLHIHEGILFVDPVMCCRFYKTDPSNDSTTLALTSPQISPFYLE